MKLILIFTVAVLLAGTSHSQFNLSQFNNERIRVTGNGMLVLGSWGLANIVTGAIGLTASSGETEYFHRMNLIWGSVNLVIAGSTWLGLRKQRPGLSFQEAMQAQSAIEKTFLINGGLDLVYLTAGLYCNEKSKNEQNPDKYKGYGNSLFVQGGSLLLFDIIMYITHLKHGRQLYKVLDKLQFSGNGIGLLWKL